MMGWDGTAQDRTDERSVRDIGALGAMDVCTDEPGRIGGLVELGAVYSFHGLSIAMAEIQMIPSVLVSATFQFRPTA